MIALQLDLKIVKRGPCGGLQEIEDMRAPPTPWDAAILTTIPCVRPTEQR